VGCEWKQLRIYTDREIAEALQLLREINNCQRVSEKTGIPRTAS